MHNVSQLGVGSGTVELLKVNLAIEPDLQNFIQFILTAASSLGGNAFSATLATLELTRELRTAGAATGYPLPASMKLVESTLLVAWGENGHHLAIATFPEAPAASAVEKLHHHLQQSTAIADPSLLLRRNSEMERFLNETRERTEREIKSMQEALEKRQEELSASLLQAETDPLTGLLNRRAYDDKLSRAFRRVVRQADEPLSLILFDLDYFKQINDEFGHQYGDAYLNKMAHAMRSAIRSDVDLVFRFGGDEFAAILFADKEIAIAKALEVLTAMKGRVSIGIASISVQEPCDGDLEHFIHRADDALYQAKRTGRGRVVADSLHADGPITWDEYLPETANQ